MGRLATLLLALLFASVCAAQPVKVCQNANGSVVGNAVTGPVDKCLALTEQTPEWNGYVNDTQGASVSVTTAGNNTLTVGSPIFASGDVGKTINIWGAGANLLGGANTWTLAGGSGYPNGTYAFVPLTCVTCADPRASQAYATITVNGSGNVSNVNTATKAGQEGYYYTVGDVLSAPAAFLGGSGSGFQITLTTTSNANLLTTITGFTDARHVTLAATMNPILSSNTCGAMTCQENIWWGGKFGAGSINDAAFAAQTAFNNGANTVHFSGGNYAFFNTLVPPSTHAWHIRCDPGAVLIAMGPLNAPNPANLNIPYNSMIDVQYPPSASVNANTQANYGSTIEGCMLEGAFAARNGIVTRAFKTHMYNNVMLDFWRGSGNVPFNSAIGVGSAITIMAHGQGSSISDTEINTGAAGVPFWPNTVSQQMGMAHGIKIVDTDTMTDHTFINDYLDTSVQVSGVAHITANVSSGSRNLVVTANDHWLHIGDHVSDCSNANCSGGPNGAGFIPPGAVIVSGPVNGQALPFVVATVSGGNALISNTGINGFAAGQEVILYGPLDGSGNPIATTVTGLTVGFPYYVSSVGLGTGAFQLCAKATTACIVSGTGIVTPGGTGTWTVVANGLNQGTTGTFVMSDLATGTQNGDSVQVGDPIPLASGGTPVWAADGGSAAHIWQVHAFQSGGATATGPCWQIDISVAMLDSSDQCDNQAAVADGLSLRYASNVVHGFFSNLGTSYYVAQRGVHIDPGSNSAGNINNPQQSSVKGTIQQGYGTANANLLLVVDGTTSQNNDIEQAAANFTMYGSGSPVLANSNGTLFQASDVGAPTANWLKAVPSIEGPLAANIATLGLISGTGAAQNDLNWRITAPSANAGSGFHGGDITIVPGAGDTGQRNGIWSVNGVLVTGGTAPTFVGTGACASGNSVIQGGANGGKFTCGGTGSGTITVTFSGSGGSGFGCAGNDLTSGVPFVPHGTNNNTTCKLDVTVNANTDALQVWSIGY